jgi:hypothetical protein
MVTLRSGRSTDTSRVAVKLEGQPREPAELTYLSAKHPRGTDSATRTAKRRPRLNPPRTEFGVGNVATFEPGTPTVLSPTRTASTVSSPGDDNDTWDSPDRTREHSDGTLKSEASSPIAPPTVYEVLDKQTPVSKALKVVQASAVKIGSNTHAVVQIQTRSRKKENEKLEQIQSEDYSFKPRKLIRNLTKELQASKAYDPTLYR